MRERGQSQNRIAKALGITQARVSHYLSRKRRTYEDELHNNFAITEADLNGYSKALADDALRNEAEAIFTLYSIWKKLLFSGAACALHQRTSGVPAGCTVCMELHRPYSDVSREAATAESQDTLILRDLSDAVASIESSASFPRLMPEISVNIAFSRPKPESSRDVAAIPGRINRVHGRARALLLPEFGCSNHMSNVVMIFNSKNSRLRAAMNIKHDSEAERVIGLLNLPFCHTAARDMKRERRKRQSGTRFDHNRDADVLSRLSKVNLPAARPEYNALVVFDRGSEGVEPMTYLLGQSATEVSEVALRIAREYNSHCN